MSVAEAVGTLIASFLIIALATYLDQRRGRR